jgi:hypothetical protein
LFGHPDRLSGAVLSLLAVVALIEAAPLPYGTVRAPDAGFFPKTLAALLLFFGLGIFFNSFLTKAPAVQFTTRSWQVAIAAAAFIAYALVLQRAGFIIATIALMLLVMRGLGGMSWKQSLLITIPGVMLSPTSPSCSSACRCRAGRCRTRPGRRSDARCCRAVAGRRSRRQRREVLKRR